MMFALTIASKPLRRFTSQAPSGEDGDIFSRIHDLPPAAAIRTYIDAFRQSADMALIRRDVEADYRSLRAEGRLGDQLEFPGRRIAFLESWNDFLAGSEDPRHLSIVIAPALRLIESEVVRLFNVGKRADGPLLDHDEAPVDMATARNRLLTIEPEMNQALSEGRSLDRHAGITTEHDGSGIMRVRLQDGGRPLVERARRPAPGDKIRTWRPVELICLEPAREPEPAF